MSKSEEMHPKCPHRWYASSQDKLICGNDDSENYDAEATIVLCHSCTNREDSDWVKCQTCGSFFLAKNEFCYKCLSQEDKWRLGVL